MDILTWTYILVGLSFALYIGIAIWTRAGSTNEFYVAGGGVSNLLGEGGVLDGLESIFGDVASGEAFGSVGGFLGTAITAINTAKNFKSLSKEGLKQEAINILSNPATVRGTINTVGGIVGAAFPKNSGTTTGTTATQKRLINPADDR